MIPVILIDSDLMFCQLLQKIITHREINVIGEAATGAKGIELVRQNQKTSPLVVLVNTQLPDMSGEAACLSIYRHWPHIRCNFFDEYGTLADSISFNSILRQRLCHQGSLLSQSGSDPHGQHGKNLPTA
jgi:DNA-binding NarL/FixJ family response regulator